MENSATLGDLIAHAQQAARELGSFNPSIVVESIGIHGYVALAPGVDPPASGRGRTAVEAASALLETLVKRLADLG